MRREIYFTLLCIVSIIACNSCEATIFEDREECPCFLTLDLSNVPPTMGELYLWAFDNEDNLILIDTIHSSNLGNKYEVKIKRTMVNYYLWANIASATKLINGNSIDTQLSKVEDVSADSLYCYSNILDASGEFAADTVNMHKEYAKVEVLVKKGENTTIEVEGSSNGYFINGAILDNKSTWNNTGKADSNNDVLHAFNITRQSELSELTLMLNGKLNNIPIILNTYPIGQWLKEQGYSMDEHNLSDIYIEIDSSNNFISITVDDWNYTPTWDVEI